jgi:hypothetical protein
MLDAKGIDDNGEKTVIKEYIESEIIKLVKKEQSKKFF